MHKRGTTVGCWSKTIYECLFSTHNQVLKTNELHIVLCYKMVFIYLAIYVQDRETLMLTYKPEEDLLVCWQLVVQLRASKLIKGINIVNSFYYRESCESCKNEGKNPSNGSSAS